MPSPYLEGLLAAVRPAHRRAAVPPPIELPPEPADPTIPTAAPDETFSPEERIKRHLHPLDAFTRLLDCASANRPPDPDDQFRFRWFGLFYQAPGQDAFTLRLRLPGGRMKPFQLAGLAHLTQRCAGGQAVFNSQGGLDLPGVPITSAVEILERAADIGLSATRTGGDCVQAVRGGELDGPPVYPLVRALEQALAHGSVFSDLPLPCEIIFAGADEPAAVPPTPAIETIILRALPDSTVFLGLPGEVKEWFLLPSHRVISACLELLKGWAAGADRSSREKAGLSVFLTGIGADKICALLGGAKQAPLPPGGLPVENNPFTGLWVPGSRLLSGQLTALEQSCHEQGWQEIRLRRGHLYAVGADGKIPDAAAVLRRALSA